MISVKKRILITGGTGFIGQNLLDILKDETYEVVLLSRKKNPKLNFFIQGLKIIEGDLSNKQSLIKALSAIDILVNLAGEKKNKKLLQKTNIDGTKNLIDAIKINKISQIIHLSSVGVVGTQYSFHPKNINEQTLNSPKNEYERSKLKSEELFMEFANANRWCNLVVLRPTNVFGEYHPQNVLLNFFKKIQSNTFFYDKRSIVNYLYVKDLADVIRFFIKSDRKYNGIFNVGYSTGMIDFVKSVHMHLDYKSKDFKLPSVIFYILNAVLPLLPNTIKNKLKSLSNKVIYSDIKLSGIYNYPFGIEKGLGNTIKYYRKIKLL